MTEKSNGLVLRIIPYSDSSVIASVLTPGQSRLSVIAKGARQPKSRYSSIIQPFNEIEMVYSFKHGRDVQTLSQASLVTRRTKLLEDYDRMMLGYRLLKWLVQIPVSGDESSDLYQLAKGGLDYLDSKDHLYAGFFPKFLFRLTQVFGYEPNYLECAKCNSPLTSLNDKEESGLNLSKGLMFCPTCKWNTAIDRHVSNRSLLLLSLWTGQFNDQVSGFWQPAEYQQIENVLLQHIGFHMDLKLE